MSARVNRKLLLALSLLVISMFAFAFALVPIYNTLCKSLGINGKTQQNAVTYQPNHAIDTTRTVVVEFVATNNSGIPWLFYPKTTRISVHPGEMAKLEFYAENKTNHRMTVQAIPSVTPGIAAQYIKKTECFCFTHQTLEGHEGMNMPLVFHLDADLPKEVNTLTLAYTLFDVTGRVST
ncbi:MAG: cytochrome c oxidase assembly protein [Legionella sp. 21-45-4]|nr:MAG: cytochrome c oxidase assembly protein [Legionella sp. 21-45-4]